MPHSPKCIVYIRPDTIGDLVIFSSALEQLISALPNARHTLVVRKGYDNLAPLFPPQINWLTTSINPFSQKPGAVREPLSALLKQLEALQPDVIVAPTINRTWLETAVAAHFPKARRISLGDNTVDPLFANALLLELGIDAAGTFPEQAVVTKTDTDWAANHRLADLITGTKLPLTHPKLTVPAQDLRKADDILSGLGLRAGEFFSLFPAGLANVPMKAWPTDNFAAIAAWLSKEHRHPIILLGHSSEEPILKEVADKTAALGAPRPPIWLGRDGELPLLAAILERSRAYIGHDTGAMHIAASLGKPVAGIFGGGHWPRFRPTGRQVVSVVHPLPCFGCNWDCHWGNAPCVKSIAVADVQRAATHLFSSATTDFDIVVECGNLSKETLAFIECATPRYKSLQSDRLERQYKIEELKNEADFKDTEIAELKKAADDIKAELEAECAEKDTEIADLKKAADTKDSEIDSLKKETDSKDTEIDSLKKEADFKDAEIDSLKKETDSKDTEILSLKSEANTKDAEIDALKIVCNERENLIITQDGHIKHFQRTVADFQIIVADRDRQIAELGTKITALENELVSANQQLALINTKLAALPPNTLDYATWLQDKDVHIRNIEALLGAKNQEISDLSKALEAKDQSIANFANGLASLEITKHYGMLLAQKEAVLQTLHRACVEREAVITRLTAEAAGAGRLHKVWFACKSYMQSNWWTPLSNWSFRKIVEDYWMRIGVLHHYAPKPLVWDTIPKAKLPDSRLPQLAIVTPSYGQAAFIESTMLSVLNQNYPKLLYVVQDGGSKDRTPEIIFRYSDRLHAWASEKDAGQADAVHRGFARVEAQLGPDDIMAWLNSDDFLAPNAMRFVAEYFAKHPEVDVVYGHRIIIDENDKDVGRWIMPPHEPKALEWIDYVPQETMFWRKRAWDKVGGIDTSYQFALDWDLLARFTQAHMKIVRLPYFLGCFRVHPTQKTSAAIHTTGAEEMRRVRTRFHGPDRQGDMNIINIWARRVRLKGAITARLHGLGIRW